MSRGHYLINAQTMEELTYQLNRNMQFILDRLDKLEGIRGKTSFVGEGMDVTGDVVVRDSDEETIHSME